jgi:hypothetical protein
MGVLMMISVTNILPIRATVPAVSLLALILTTPASIAQAQDIGTIALSVAQVTGTPPGSGARALSVGARVMQDEEISTGAQSRAEVLFRDQTSLSLGANTTVVLDRFVFDPGSGSGDMTLRMTQGALRFIGGSLSDNRPAIVTTSTATIGVRGSSALISSSGQQTRAVFIAGDELCLTPLGSSNPVCTTQIGGLLTEDGFQGIVPPDVLNQMSNQIDSIPVGDGQSTDLGSLDLGEVITLDVQPYSTGGTQPPEAPDILSGPQPVTAQTPVATQPPQGPDNVAAPGPTEPQEPAPPADTPTDPHLPDLPIGGDGDFPPASPEGPLIPVFGCPPFCVE